MNSSLRRPPVALKPQGLPWRLTLIAAALLTSASPWLWAQGAAAPAATSKAPLQTDAPGPVGGAPDQLPSAEQLRQAIPRPVLAATAALGLGRQRLALVLSLGTPGAGPALDSAARDSLAVATALRAAGFVVMVREDVSRTELRAALQDFRERLQASGMGLVYATGLGAQVDGRNLLLLREAQLDATAPAPAVAERLRLQAVPLQELVDALAGTAAGAGGARLLVVDAAYQHPALDKLPQPGLTAQPLPPGVMALFARPTMAVQARPTVPPLPNPAPTDAQLLAASPFARLLVKAVMTPKISGAEVLRSTQRALADSTQGAVVPWLAGDTDASEDLAELSLLDAVLPRTPEEYTREAAKRTMAQMVKGDAARAGEQPVAEVLQQAQAPAAPSTPAGNTGNTNTTEAAKAAPDGSRTSLPEVPSGTSALGSTASALGSVASAAGTAVSVAGTVAVVAATAATAAASVKAAQASAAVSIASTAVGAATAVAGNVVGMATRLGSGGAGESSAGQVAAAAKTAAAAAAAPPVTAAATAAATAATANAAATVATTAASTAATVVPAATTPAAAAAAGAAARSGAVNATRALAATAGEMSVAEVLKDSPTAAGTAQTARAQTPAPTGPASTTTVPPANDGRTVRNSGGGERPAYNPRTNAHGYAEGDTFTYRVRDTWKDEVTGRYTTAIEEVLDNGLLLANSQQVALDPQGRLKLLRGADGSVQQFEPYQDLWWSKPTAGQSRDVNFKEIFQRADKTQGQTQYKGSSSVGRLRKVETPAGEFDALPIETSGWYEEVLSNGMRNVGQFERTVWYSPQLGHPVAIDIKDMDRLGKLLKRERVELMHAQQTRTPP